MRMLGIFFGGAQRNGNWLLEDPHPIKDYGNSVCTGDAGRDGYTVLSRANPCCAGSPPPVAGTRAPLRRGPDQSFEQ